MSVDALVFGLLGRGLGSGSFVAGSDILPHRLLQQRPPSAASRLILPSAAAEGC